MASCVRYPVIYSALVPYLHLCINRQHRKTRERKSILEFVSFGFSLALELGMTAYGNGHGKTRAWSLNCMGYPKIQDVRHTAKLIWHCVMVSDILNK